MSEKYKLHVIKPRQSIYVENIEPHIDVTHHKVTEGGALIIEYDNGKTHAYSPGAWLEVFEE